ncbi:hypothetical protein ACFDTO_25440 [Microbacteriaceae bacterium 4G12]
MNKKLTLSFAFLCTVVLSSCGVSNSKQTVSSDSHQEHTSSKEIIPTPDQPLQQPPSEQVGFTTTHFALTKMKAFLLPNTHTLRVNVSYKLSTDLLKQLQQQNNYTLTLQMRAESQQSKLKFPLIPMPKVELDKLSYTVPFEVEIPEEQFNKYVTSIPLALVVLNQDKQLIATFTQVDVN